MDPKDDQHDDMAKIEFKPTGVKTMATLPGRAIFRRLQSLEQQVETLRQQIRDNGGFNKEIEDLKRANDIMARQITSIMKGHDKLFELISKVVDTAEESQIIMPGGIN